MSAPKSVGDIFRTLAEGLFPRRTPAEVIGYTNGVLTVAVDGKVRNIEHAGVEEIVAGDKVWVRRVPDDAHDNYSYEGFRLEGGTTNPSNPTPTTQPPVSEASIAKYGSGTRVRDGDTNTTFPVRKYIEFQGAAVTVIDDPANNKVIIQILSVTPPDYDWDDPAVDWDDPDVAWGG